MISVPLRISGGFLIITNRAAPNLLLNCKNTFNFPFFTYVFEYFNQQRFFLTWIFFRKFSS